MYTIIHFDRLVNDTTHTLMRKLVFCNLFGYYVFNLLMNWFLPANFYLAFYFLTTSGGSVFSHLKFFSEGLNLLYIFITTTMIVLGLGNRPDEMKQVYLLACLIYGIFSLLVFVLSIDYVMNSEPQVLHLKPAYIKAATLASFAAYFVAALLHGEFVPIASTFFQYTFMLPTFTNIFAIYSYCNIHDISWGTKGIGAETKPAAKAKKGKETGEAGGAGKGADAVHEAEEEEKEEEAKPRRHAKPNDVDEEADEKQRAFNETRDKKVQQNVKNEAREVEKEFKAFRSSLLLAWMITNVLFAYMVSTRVLNQGVYLPLLFMVAVLFTGFRFIGSVWFYFDRLVWLFRRKLKKPGEERRKIKTREERREWRGEQRKKLELARREKGERKRRGSVGMSV